MTVLPAFFILTKLIGVIAGEIGAYRKMGWAVLVTYRGRDTDVCLLMFQGDSGRNGEPGSMGPPGPKVSWSYCGTESIIVSTSKEGALIVGLRHLSYRLDTGYTEVH